MSKKSQIDHEKSVKGYLLGPSFVKPIYSLSAVLTSCLGPTHHEPNLPNNPITHIYQASPNFFTRPCNFLHLHFHRHTSSQSITHSTHFDSPLLNLSQMQVTHGTHSPKPMSNFTPLRLISQTNFSQLEIPSSHFPLLHAQPSPLPQPISKFNLSILIANNIPNQTNSILFPYDSYDPFTIIMLPRGVPSPTNEELQRRWKSGICCEDFHVQLCQGRKCSANYHPP